MDDPLSPWQSPQPKIVPARPVTVRPHATTPRPSPLELPGLPMRGARLDLALIVVVALVVPFGVQVFAAAWGVDAELEPGTIDIVVVQKWFDALLAGGLMVYLLLRHRLAPVSFGLRFDRAARQLLWTIGSLGATYAWLILSMMVIVVLVLLLPELEEDLMERTKLVYTMPVDDFFRTVLLLIPVAAHEELLFRGLLLPYLRRITGRWSAAILICSVVFAVLHFNQGWIGVTQILGVSVILGVFFVLSRSLIAVTIAHFLFNFLQFQFIRLLPWPVEGVGG